MDTANKDSDDSARADWKADTCVSTWFRTTATTSDKGAVAADETVAATVAHAKVAAILQPDVVQMPMEQEGNGVMNEQNLERQMGWNAERRRR